MKTSSIKDYTVREEVFNALTHGIGVAFGITALVILVMFSVEQNNIWKIVSSSLFGSTLVLMYLTSTLYHSFSRFKIRRLLKTLDHAAIYLLIAGTYTPLTLVNLRGAWGWTLFGVIWGLALFGIIFKIFFVYRLPTISTLFYLLMGWLVVIAAVPIYHHFAFSGLMWLVAGGLCYSLGTIFYAWESVKYMHGVWHLWVIAGTVCHFFAILFYVVLV